MSRLALVITSLSKSTNQYLLTGLSYLILLQHHPSGPGGGREVTAIIHVTLLPGRNQPAHTVLPSAPSPS